MNRPTGRLTRLVGLARLREDQARLRVAAARSAERVARDGVIAGEQALRIQARRQGDFRFRQELLELGRGSLAAAEHQAERTVRHLDGELDQWRETSRRLQSLERLEARHLEVVAARQRAREQQDHDELAGSRGAPR